MVSLQGGREQGKSPVLGEALERILSRRQAVSLAELDRRLPVTPDLLRTHLHRLVDDDRVERLCPVNGGTDTEAVPGSPAGWVYYRWRRAGDGDYVWQRRVNGRGRMPDPRRSLTDLREMNQWRE
jgi:hypothetical protein